MDGIELRKIQGQELAKARVRTGAGKQRIDITDQEWAAIQAGAVSNNTLKQILLNADQDRIKELATPRTQILMTPIMLDRAHSMDNLGYTQAEIADQLGVSLTTLKTAL